MRHRCAALLLATVALPALAENANRPNGIADETGFLTVYAPRLLRASSAKPSDPASTQTVSIEHRVSYAGLDLAMHADVLELRKRIVESAETACAQLEVLYPLADLDTAACERGAIKDAMERARKVVAAAMESAAAR
jgi:UrcA family protein